MSFDNVGDRFEYVRYHGRWPLLEKNVGLVKNLIKKLGHWGGIHAVYNLYNCTRLCELREWSDAQNLKIHWQTLYQPECLDPALHGRAVVDLALQEIQIYRARFALAPDEKDFFTAVQSRFEQASDLGSQQQQIQAHIASLETKYHRPGDGLSFRSLWPELSDVLYN